MDLFCIALCALLVYSNTFSVPWYFDDVLNIVENSGIRDIGQSLRGVLTNRGLAQLTFALNYRLGGVDVSGYHLVNLLIHIVTGWIVLLIFRRLFRESSWLPLAGALLFIVHPLQTQSVTYIVQRLASLCGLFFFAAIALFLRAYEERARGAVFTSVRHLVWYISALLAGLLALLTKQNAATLPLILGLFLWLQPDERPTAEGWRSRTLYLLPFLAVPLVATAQQVLLPLFAGTNLSALGGYQTLSTLRTPTPLDYLFTEFSVLWLYLRLFLLPFGQALDYGYPVVEQLWTLRNLLALSGLVGLVVLAWRLRRRRPLITLGIFWFFATLAVESSLIPLDPVFEHRMYVPLFGLVLIVLDLLSQLTRPRLQLGIVCCLLLGFGLLTWRRNQLWNDPVAFYEDNLRRAPHSERVNVDLAKSYMDKGRDAEAEKLLRRALEINPDIEFAYVNLSIIYADRGEYARARDLLLSAANRFPKSPNFLDSLGTIYDLMGEPAQAERLLRQVLILRPFYANAYLNLGALYARQERWDEAIDLYRQSLSRFPETSMLCYNYGIALHALKRYAEARDQFRRAYRLDPDDADAAYNLGLVSLSLGDRATATALLPALRRLDAEKARTLESELASPAAGER